MRLPMLRTNKRWYDRYDTSRAKERVAWHVHVLKGGKALQLQLKLGCDDWCQKAVAHVDAVDGGGSWRRRENRKHAKTHANACASNLSELQRALQRSTGGVDHRGRCSRSRRQVHCTSRDHISAGESRERGKSSRRMSSRVEENAAQSSSASSIIIDIIISNKQKQASKRPEMKTIIKIMTNYDKFCNTIAFELCAGANEMECIVRLGKNGFIYSNMFIIAIILIIIVIIAIVSL